MSWDIAHAGYGVPRIVGQTYMGLQGIFGVPLDVAATYIVLFTLYGAVLEYSGAGRFFLDISLAATGQRRTGPGRTTAMAGFLLGTVSGSGVATTVTLGSVTWPILRRGGYPKDEGGGVLAASGIGAILSPPTLGAAAFIIAEFLGVSYLTVLVYALIPSVLYYLGIFLAIEADARRFETEDVKVETPPAGKLILRYGYHFSSLFAIVFFMAIGLSPFRAVLYATVLAFLLSFLDPKHRMTPVRVGEALAAGARAVLPVAATCAAAGIIVAVVTLTGLGLNLSGIIIDVAGGSLFLCALLAAVAVLLLGLAVPVTASFIIAAVIVSPALTKLGVEPLAAYMFIFYYAVLSEVSPPTALSAVAAAAITGGNAFRTMMLTWKYTLPAFLVPFAFVLTDNGEGPAAAGLGGDGAARLRGVRARGRRAGGGDRRVAAGPRADPRARAVRRRRDRAALPRAAVDRDRPRRSSPSASSSTSWGGVRRRAGCAAPRGSARRARRAARTRARLSATSGGSCASSRSAARTSSCRRSASSSRPSRHAWASAITSSGLRLASAATPPREPPCSEVSRWEGEPTKICASGAAAR